MVSGGYRRGITVPSSRQSTFRLYFQFLDEMKCNRTPQNLLRLYNYQPPYKSGGVGRGGEERSTVVMLNQVYRSLLVQDYLS